MTQDRIDHRELCRYESLGDNCEFGFVLRSLGRNFGGVFQWARSEPELIASLLRVDFADSFMFEHLTPYENEMVLDRSTGIAWHTKLGSTVVGGQRCFISDETTRWRLWQVDSAKMRALERRFRRRAEIGGSIFVIKSNRGVDPAALDDIQASIQLMTFGASFNLLEVCETSDSDRIGTVVRVGPSRLRGFISKFAPYDDAVPRDLAQWAGVLRMALEIAPCEDWEKRLSRIRSEAPLGSLRLLFPEKEGGIDGEHLLGSPIGVLECGNSWCRCIDDQTYRLHGPWPDQPPAVLSWRGVRAPGSRRLVASVVCPVPDSLPLRLHVEVMDNEGNSLGRQELIVSPGEPQAFGLDVELPDSPVTIRLCANSIDPVRNGERSVVDLSSLELLTEEKVLGPISDLFLGVA